jgi:peptidoglycan/xylan/chitin deacetylase (PgdA/CDA1 family)
MFGQMYHHFHDDILHQRGQGSIDANTFRSILTRTELVSEILSPEHFSSKVQSGSIQPSQTCITFDDALLCQYDVAAPVMQEMGIKGFFFVYSSVLGEQPDALEFYRDFRNTWFKNIEDFYTDFFSKVESEFSSLYATYICNFPEEYLLQFIFYTENDRRFRFFRDHIAGPKLYYQIMDAMLDSAGYDRKSRAKELFMGVKEIKKLAEDGHEIGLHSYSHPTKINSLSIEQQYKEYSRNKSDLEDIIGRRVWSMSHPCGRYNDDTLQILLKLGITLGFRHSLHESKILSALEVPRENHTNLVKKTS